MSGERLSGLEKMWQDLQQCDSDEVCKRGRLQFIDGAYVIPFMDSAYRIDPVQKSISNADGNVGTPVKSHLAMLLLAYLNGADPMEPSGNWVTASQLPGGDLFFSGPHGLPVAPLLARYGEKPDEFLDRCRKLGAEVLEFGDASVSFSALPKLPVAFVLWAGDDEFPADLKVMFDSTADRHVPLDILLSLVRSVTDEILKLQ